MNEFIVKLVKMRKSPDTKEQTTYTESFKTASEFLIYKHEFIPFNLFLGFDNGKKILSEITHKHGDPIITTRHDKALSTFYKNHSLKRDINHIVDNIAYLTITEEKLSPLVVASEVQKDDFYDLETISKLAINHSQPYHAQENDLRQIGQSIADYILYPTNYWLEKIRIFGFEKTPERYWQVAGVFKKRIWGKLQHVDHTDKKVFLCLGVDLENRRLFYGLECLRTGTSKLSTEQIFKFDLFTRDFNLFAHIDFDEINEFNWQSIIAQSEDFLNELIPLYDQVIDYIWNDTVDIKAIRNHLIPLNTKKLATDKELIDINKKIKSLGVELVIAYEKEFLKYKGKNKILKKVKKSDHAFDYYDIVSYHLDGSEKLIKVLSSKSSSIRGAVISKACIDASIVNAEKSYCYVVTDISNKRKSGILHINKGRLDKAFSMKAESYIIAI